VLVQGAVLPEAKDLPSSLQVLARLQAHEQNDKSWRHDMQVLLKLLETRTGRVAADPFERYWGMWQGLRQLGATLVSPHWLAVSAAVALAGAIGVGLYVLRQRADEANADVALLMRPYNIHLDALDEIQVFKDLRGALKLALPDSHVELIPLGNVAAEELDRYRPEEKEELLKIKGERGYPRIFIQTHYSFDKPTGVRRVLVTPLLRPTDPSQKRWKSVEGWPVDTYDGPVSRRVAVKVAFELIEFLSAKGVLRLQPEELRNARATLLDDYRGVLVTVQPPCEAERNLLAALADTAAAGANAESTRSLLNITCTKDEVSPAPDRSARTATAVYRGALGL
jgi:hypothetical protein